MLLTLAHELQGYFRRDTADGLPMAVHPERFDRRVSRTHTSGAAASPVSPRSPTPAHPHTALPSARAAGLALAHVACCVCGAEDCVPAGIGEDFEYRTSPDTFIAMRCRECGLVYLDPRPTVAELPRIYPPNYHAFDFSPERFGFVYRVRRSLEARRALQWCRGLGDAAQILDVGCGDGFHLRLLRDFGHPGWKLEGVDASERAAAAARRAGLVVHLGTIEQLGLPAASYDLVLLIATIEHVDDPAGVLRAVRRLLKPGGRVVIVTDNTATLDFAVFGARHWGGYHFPRHFNLFNRATLARLAAVAELDVDSIETVMSPVNWVYSVRNALVDWGAPSWLVERFSLRSPVALAFFTLVDSAHQVAGSGALLRAVLRRPATASAATDSAAETAESTGRPSPAPGMSAAAASRRSRPEPSAPRPWTACPVCTPLTHTATS
jgi:SAM-dependent methyltransferase